jgi:hypothetical protein
MGLWLLQQNSPVGVTIKDRDQGGTAMLNVNPSTEPNAAIPGDAIVSLSSTARFRAAMIVALIADALQFILFPVLIEGAESPADDVLDLGVGAILIYLLGWHWEFLPSFLAKLVPGVDMVPLWTLAVANVYRKQKKALAPAEQHP